MTTNNDLAELWRRYTDELRKSELAIGVQIEAPDPHDLAGMVIQVKLLTDLIETGHQPAEFAAAIAQLLEAMAEPSAG